ncbi:MAG: TlpA family protein disulfide reductase [Acidimicrobiia bacterium]
MRWILAGLALVVAACGGGTEGLAVVANTQQTLVPGPNRILLAVATEDGSFISRPDVPTTATFAHETAGEVTVDTEWIWAIPDVRGFHVAYVDLPEPGRWNVTLYPEEGPPTATTPFGVQTSSPVPNVGDPAIPVSTRTYPEHPLEEISSDPDPDPRLHELSLDEALANGRPTVVVFATPAFCQTASCGPTLDVVRQVMDGYPQVNWLHVEVYENLDAAAGGSLDPVEATAAWSLPSEPWVFVIDSDGIITARFEGAIGPDELHRALDSVG